MCRTCVFERKEFANFNAFGFAQAVFINQKIEFAHTNNFSSFNNQGCWCKLSSEKISLLNVSATPIKAVIRNIYIDKKSFKK
jgi:hypothetical protein